MSAGHRRDGWLARAEHIWVVQNRMDQQRLPGLLLAWRRQGGDGRRVRWEGWVIYVELGPPAHEGGPFVRQGWVGATVIERRG